MNTITQIESALQAINQASFQTIISHLLCLQGNNFIGTPSSSTCPAERHEERDPKT